MNTGVLRAAAFGLVAALLAGCLQVEQTIVVRPDGSGVLIERFLMQEDTVQMFAANQPQGQAFTLRDETKLRGRAAVFGDSVEYVSSEDLRTEFGRGYIARYAFADIDRFRLSQDAGDGFPGVEGKAPAAGEQKFTTFSLQRGAPARLAIHWPVTEAGPEEAAKPGLAGTESESGSQSAEEQAMAMEMMRTMLGELRVAIHVEVVGDIVDSNAGFQEGSRVTLMDIAFAELLSNDAMMEAMSGRNSLSVADVQKMKFQLPGIRLEMQPEVIVRFQ